jgi:uncharacterized membrane protein YphA (DoxX/SURF4 family)
VIRAATEFNSFKLGAEDAPRMLQRLFSAFPDGWQGTSLLLLRTVFGAAVLTEGFFYLAEPNPTAAIRSLGLLALAAGILLVIGFLTPIAGALVGLAGLGLATSVIPPPVPNFWGSQLAVVFGLTILLAILGLGPGAFSLDARVFGRREIIIPPADFPPD